MDYKEGKVQIFFTWVYLVLMTHFLWVAGLILGLGFFGLVPTTITSYEMIKEASDERTRSRLKVFRFWWTNIKKNMKSYYQTSGLFSLYGLILLTNHSFLNRQTSFVTYILFYLTIFLFILGAIVLLWFSFIAAEYPKLSKKEILQNAIAFSLSRAVELLIFFTLLISVYLLIWSGTPGLIIFTGFGILPTASYWVFMKLHDGYGIHQLFKGWRQQY